MTKKPKEFSGGCLCGHIRFQATGKPTFPHLCSCRMCQTWSGAPTVAWVEFPLKNFSWTGPGGEPAKFKSSEKTQRGFCPNCGGSICAIDEGYDKISLTITTFDEPSVLVPGKQFSYRKSAPKWFIADINRSS
ncbi:GFA family protein [Kiloniella antarctica]|uniref:GFA family protein n=1 Tax=Kiloniella antarctica TaxID=1550907 RepID=A0ABW5BJH0_9PROT